MKTIALALTFVCAAPAAAIANWRDRCPADADPAEGDPLLHGTLPDFDSVAGLDRLALSIRESYFMSREGFARTRQSAGVLHLSKIVFSREVTDPASVREDARKTRSYFLTATMGAITEGQEVAPPGESGLHVTAGPLVVGFGGRSDWLAQGWRHVRGWRVMYGENLAGADATTLDAFAARSALEPYLYSPRSHGVVYERRGELRGCYAPFAHLRIGAWGHPSSTPGTGGKYGYWTVAPSLALGGHAGERLAAYLQVGVQFEYPSNPLGLTTMERVRIGAEYQQDQFSAGVHVDMLFGALDGVFLGVELAYRPTWMRY